MPREAPRDLGRALGLELDTQNFGRTDQNGDERLFVVKGEPLDDAEAIAKRRLKQTRAGGGADEGKRIELKAHRARAETIAGHDVEKIIFHRGVEVLFDVAA